MAVKSQQDIVKFGNKSYPIANKFLSQFTSWAKIWMSPSPNKLPRKRKNTSSMTRDTDIRSRTNYYDQPQPETLSLSQRTTLYRATCQKLRPNNNCNSIRKLVHLGDILHVRNFWDHLETIVYQDVSQNSQYLPPSKRLPFNPDKPGSIYLPRKQKKSVVTYTSASLPRKRQSFASSTIVYSNQGKHIIKVLPVAIVLPEDDDDVPLGALHFSNLKSSPY
ncbi:hypothetical protein MFLAVUS_000102 [Mucor flavus]|uniref:Ribosomal protein S4 n=1 Tax=Mucor flavus TaxID=439312 RepID=A0ABP9YIR8_9FUNG